MFNYQRTTTQKEGPQFLEMFGVTNKPETYLELPSELIKTEPFSDSADTSTVSLIHFQLTRDLKVIR